MLTTLVSPAGSGTVSGGGYYDAYSIATVGATPAATYLFSGFSGALSGTVNPQSLLISAPTTVTGNFVPAPVAVTIASAPAGLGFSVTGLGCQPGNYTGGTTLQWQTTASCIVTFASPQSGGAGTQYVFSAWADGGTSNPRTIATPASAATYTANFNTQYLLTTVVSPTLGGTVSGGGYYNAGATATVGATPAAGYGFNGFSGALTGKITPQNLTINAPTAVTANFENTPPVITPAVTGTLGANGWYTSNVGVTWSVTDPESGIATSTGCAPATLANNTSGTTLTCSATNGAGLSSSASVTIKIDKTSPVITPVVTGTLGTNGWYTGNVGVSWTLTDPESGIGTSAGCVPATLVNNTSGTTLTCSATNGAGLSSSGSVTIKIDKTLPVISGMPGAACSLWPPNHKMVQVATVTAADGGSGLVSGSFSLTGVSNEPSDPNDPDVVIASNGAGGFTVKLRAERLGNGAGRVYTLTAKATDLAGNAVTATSTCTVAHDQGN